MDEDDWFVGLPIPAGGSRCPWCGYDLAAMPPMPITAHLFVCDRCLNELPATEVPSVHPVTGGESTDAA